jgi:hypothetical protein
MIGTTLGHHHRRLHALLEKYDADYRVGHWWDTQAQPVSTRANRHQ